MENLPFNHQSLNIVTDPKTLEKLILYKISTTISSKGELVFPCIPAMLDYYLQWIERLFFTLDRPLPSERKEAFRQLLARKLQEGFTISPTSFVTFKYESLPQPEKGLVCHFELIIPSLGEQYHHWIKVREPPLFGLYPDAKIMDFTRKFANPSQVKILDIGAGNGRNTLPLARLGYGVDAIELTPNFVQQLRTEIERENLPVKVIEGDILNPLISLDCGGYQFIIASEVVSHFRNLDQLGLFLAKTCDLLSSGGFLLFNTFVTLEGYEPDPLIRQVAQLSWSSLSTPEELTHLIQGFPFIQRSSESVFDYERTHLPPQGWPPTPWFESWSTGRDLFPLAEGRPPVELRWILCQRV